MKVPLSLEGHFFYALFIEIVAINIKLLPAATGGMEKVARIKDGVL
jgi:hypothetical protein